MSTKEKDTFITQIGATLQETLLSVPDGGSITTRLDSKRAEMETVDAELQAKLSDFESRISGWRTRESSLRARQDRLRDRVQRYQKERNEQEGKIIRAMKKYEDVVRQREEKEEEVRNLRQNLSKLRAERGSKMETLEQLETYQGYLTNVVEAGGGVGVLQEPADVLRRYTTLEETGKHLRQRIEEDQADAESLRVSVGKSAAERQTESHVAAKTVDRLQKELEERRSEAAEREAEAERRREEATRTAGSLGQLRQSVRNLHSRCSVGVRASRPSVRVMDSPDMMDEVAEAIVDLLYVVNSYHKSKEA